MDEHNKEIKEIHDLIKGNINIMRELVELVRDLQKDVFEIKKKIDLD